MVTKNLGQVAAIYIDSIPPDNTKLLWYDTNTYVIKYFDIPTDSWVSLLVGGVSTLLNLLNTIERFVVPPGGQSVFNTTGNMNVNCKASVDFIQADPLIYSKTGAKQITFTYTIPEGSIILLWN